MIKPTQNDIGRKVIYRTHRLGGRAQSMETGVLTSYNDQYAFIQYGTNQTSAATRFDELEWDNE